MKDGGGGEEASGRHAEGSSLRPRLSSDQFPGTARAHPNPHRNPVEDFETRTFGDLTVKIDRLLCVGFGDCLDEAPGVFRFDEDGIVTFGDDASPGEVERRVLLEACRSCPVDALIVLDAEGRQLHPDPGP